VTVISHYRRRRRHQIVIYTCMVLAWWLLRSLRDGVRVQQISVKK